MAGLVFFGSGPVASKSLELLSKKFEIEAVVTKPKPAHHRGSFPVLDLCDKLNFPVKTVSNKAELDELIATKPFDSAAGVLIDFGIIVSQKVIDYFPKGIINSHFSLLPEWRGADPITFSILSGQKRTGVSLMLLVEKMDEGPVIGCGIQELDGTETTPVLTEKLILLSDALLKKELPDYLSGKTSAAPQNELPGLIPGYPTHVSYSRKLTKEDGRIDWTKPAEVLEREIRAYAQWPKSYIELANQTVIITRAKASEGTLFYPDDVHRQGLKPGTVIGNHKDGITVQCGGVPLSILRIDFLKPAGKKEMAAKEFLSGYGKDL